MTSLWDGEEGTVNLRYSSIKSQAQIKRGAKLLEKKEKNRKTAWKLLWIAVWSVTIT